MLLLFFFKCPHSTLTGSVFLGPLGLGYVFLPSLLFLLFLVTCLDHLGQFPGQQCTGNEERCESQYDSGEESIGVFGSPLYHVLCPCPNVNHPVQQMVRLTHTWKRVPGEKAVKSQTGFPNFSTDRFPGFFQYFSGEDLDCMTDMNYAKNKLQGCDNTVHSNDAMRIMIHDRRYDTRASWAHSEQ